ncbi:ribosome silencing factor [Thermaurantiacus sp.]
MTPIGRTRSSPLHPESLPLTEKADAPSALLDLVLTSLDDDQALDVVAIPLEGKSALADHMVIASGRSSRQVASMAEKLAQKIRAEFRIPVRTEGLGAADWVLLDAGDVIVHLFRPEVRQFYALEKMWAFDAHGAPMRAAGAPA